MINRLTGIIKKIPYLKPLIRYYRFRDFYQRMGFQRPHEILIETTNRCNLRCPMCFTYKATRKKGIMDLVTYKKVIEQAVSFGIENVHLYTVGEPLLHPYLVEMVQIAKENKRNIFIFTNGMLLTENITPRLIGAHLDNVIISIDGYSKEKYERMRSGGDFDKLLKNVTNFKRLRDSNGKHTRIEIWSIVSDENSSDLQGFYDFWSPFADKVQFIYLSNQGGYIKNIESGADLFNGEERRPCPTLGWTTVVLWNGDISMCCVDFDGRLVVGNISNDNLKDVWFGEKYRKARLHHIMGRFDVMPMCGSCDGGLINVGNQLNELNLSFENKFPRRVRPDYENEKGIANKSAFLPLNGQPL